MENDGGESQRTQHARDECTLYAKHVGEKGKLLLLKQFPFTWSPWDYNRGARGAANDGGGAQGIAAVTAAETLPPTSG